MKMSEEMAVRLHRMMWSDMQRELGDTPDDSDRNRFKEKWCETHFPGEYIHFNCFLCEYCGHDYNDNGCDKCPIEWPDGVCSRAFGKQPVKVDYRFAPISEILALPTRNKELVTGYVVNDVAALARSYYEYREQLLSKASGIPASSAIEDHVKAIKEKAVQQSDFSKMYCDAKMELATASGLQEGDTITDHIKAIQEKAVDDYFAKMPLAKAMTTDIDEAFKQHAEEQMAPIFHALAEASGLSATNKYVNDHIGKIIEKTRKESADCTRKFMAKYSGEFWDRFTVVGHIEKIKRDANAKYVYASSLLEKYKNALSNESGLDRDKPIDVHLREIVKNSMEVGATDERDRIQEKIEELLKE